MTDLWNDSCSIQELTYAIANGAVGATTNPTIVIGVLKKELPAWRDRILAIIDENPTWTEVEVAWGLIEEMAVKGAELLLPVFEREKGKKGRLSMQTNPTFYRNAEAIVQQAMHFDSLAPNIQVKIPVTKAGLAAIEEATYRGVNINATVSLHRAAGHRRRGSGGTGAQSANGGGQRQQPDDPGMHHHDRPAGRLAQGRGEKGEHLHHPRPSRLGRHRGHEEGVHASSRNAATAPGCWWPPTATICTGRN